MRKRNVFGSAYVNAVKMTPEAFLKNAVKATPEAFKEKLLK